MDGVSVERQKSQTIIRYRKDEVSPAAEELH
jgi:hypothetical protein